LKWKRFVVAENHEGLVVGCAQIKTHFDGSRELASMVVDPNYRGRGIARTIIEYLIQNQEEDLFLICRDSMGAFYNLFGFEIISRQEMPPFFRRIEYIASLLQIIYSRDAGLLVMRKKNKGIQKRHP
jgi:N-acetylglutamate synthase-like GNAT family acetyltransferase